MRQGRSKRRSAGKRWEGRGRGGWEGEGRSGEGGESMGKGIGREQRRVETWENCEK